MLNASQKEIDEVTEYMRSQAPDLVVQMIQKVYSENVLQIRHDVWDIHTDVDRWWVITEPMNLYAQDQFPNMDLVLTFHIGLCLRLPRTDRQKLSELPIEPFALCYRCLQEASDALDQAQEVADYQSIGVRCRETLLAFIDVVQTVLPWTSTEEPPKKADLKAWTAYVCNVVLPRATHEHRRHLFKSQMESAWKFTNWLTHTTTSKWHDAEAAVESTDNAVTLFISTVLCHVRDVPEQCPACASHRLSPERGYHQSIPEVEWERPTCDKCGWTGKPVAIDEVPKSLEENKRIPPDGHCVIPTVPLRSIRKPNKKE